VKKRLVSSTAPAVIGMALVSVLLATAAAAASKSAPASQESYGNFLVGRYAMAMGDVGTASQSLTSASAGDPAEADLREKAFLVAILNGDIDKAHTISPQGTTGVSRLMGGLVGAATAVKANKPSAAVKALDGVLKVESDEKTAALLRPYAQAMNGDWKSAFDDSGDAALNASDRGRLLVYLIKAERARLYEMKGRIKDADALYASLYQPGAASFVFGPDYAGFLERQGRRDEARIVWKAMAESSGDPVSRQSLARLDTPGAKPTPLPDLKTSMAQALLLSATLYSSDRDHEMALAALRLSLYLDPSSDRARIFLGQINQDLKDSAAAETAWAGVSTGSPYAGEAALRRAWSLRARNENDEAFKLVEGVLAGSPDDIAFIAEKADILHAQGKDQDALKVLTDRAARAGSEDFTWQAWFIQAVVSDSLDNWNAAEAAITKARALAGDRPEILNFIGYGWISRDLKVKEGMELVRQAMALSPRSGAIVDSLGWGYYKLGDYEQALTYVEQAVQMDPSDPEINEHLGDVYLALGRKIEARYEWQRVLTLDATGKSAVSVRAKLDANKDKAPTAVGISQPAGAVKSETAFNDKADKTKAAQ
jgi:Flp pilus assembly protein TadD